MSPSTTTLLIAAVAVFLTIIILLVALLCLPESKLTQSGPVRITINGQNRLRSQPEAPALYPRQCQNFLALRFAAAANHRHVPVSEVMEGGGDILPTEAPYFHAKEIKENWLGLPSKSETRHEHQIPEEIFGIKKWECEVISNYNVATFIKEFIVQLA